MVREQTQKGSIQNELRHPVCQGRRSLPSAISSAAGRNLLSRRRIHRAWLNITFNYGGVFARHGLSVIRREGQTPGLQTLEGQTAAECVRILTTVIPKLGDDISTDYWEATEGNAKRALVNLLAIAITVPPDATCRVWH
ncbi:MAG: hypothetical protein IJJ33_16405 [Victivallales bacterium]|nr:hypothetical protein [Victivallales bacterium]